MPAPLVGGVLDYIATALGVTVWDGEVPRQDAADVAITPTTTVAADWPAIKAKMSDSGLDREWTLADPYSDRGEITIQAWALTREDLENYTDAQGVLRIGLLQQIEELLAFVPNWQNITLVGGPTGNPFYVVSMLLKRWTCVQEENVRAQEGQLLYRGDMVYDVTVHGATPTLR